MKQKYSIQQISSVIIISIGLIITTLSVKKNQIEINHNSKDLNQWIFGIILLIISSILGAFMGIYGEYIFKKYPNTWKECLFYKHLLSLPIFFLFSPQILQQWKLIRKTPLISLDNYLPMFIMPTTLKKMKIQGIWIYIAINTISQFTCISGVQKISSIVTSVTLDLILNIRKFLSLLISVFLFKNPFSWWSWLGSLFVFSGVLGYAQATEKTRKKQSYLLRLNTCNMNHC